MRSIGSEASVSLEDSWQQAKDRFFQKTNLKLDSDGEVSPLSPEDFQERIIELRSNRKTAEKTEKSKRQSRNIITALQKLGGIAAGGAALV